MVKKYIINMHEIFCLILRYLHFFYPVEYYTGKCLHKFSIQITYFTYYFLLFSLFYLFINYIHFFSKLFHGLPSTASKLKLI